jgi:glycosyltransferase involved in cell wall biosynthesis
MFKTFAIVVPCFNEETRFPVEYWQKILAAHRGILWIFFFFLSTDGTSGLLRELESKGNVYVLTLQPNCGKGNAVRRGLIQALVTNPELKVLGFLDSDGAFSIVDIGHLIDIADMTMIRSRENSIDAVLSSRVALSGRSIQRRQSRHYIGRIIATLLTHKWIDSPYDTQSGFKLFRNTISFRESLKLAFSTKWFVDIELLTRIAIANNGRLLIWEEPLMSWNEVSGSKLKATKLFSIGKEFITARKQVKLFLSERQKNNGLD